ncbi:MAG: helix-turn-helix domain-containing protein, partial [Candidatus Methylomirabilales bacterium]
TESGAMKSTLATDIGRRLRKMRVRRGLTQQRLAQLTEGSPDYSYIGKIERGEQLPSLKVLERLARALEVPPGQFFRAGVGEALLPEEILRLARDEARQALLRAVASMPREDIPLLLEIARVLTRHRQAGAGGKLPRQGRVLGGGDSGRNWRKVAERGEAYRVVARPRRLHAAVREIEAALDGLAREGELKRADAVQSIRRALAALKTSLGS